MIQLKHLNITMKKDLRPLVRDLDLTLGPGDKIAVIGEEGNGKSTLLKVLADPEAAEEYVQWSGTLRLDGAVLGVLEQEVSPRDAARPVLDYCGEDPAFAAADPGERAAAAGELGFPVELYYDPRPLGTLSGGEKVKLRMALLTLRRPDAYLLDEPSNDLDIPTLEWMERFIRRRREPVLFISHDEVLLEGAANAVLHLEQLRRKTLPRWTLARVPYREYVDNRARALAHQEQVARKEREEDRKQQERLRQLQQKVEHELNTISRQDPHGGRMLKKKMKAVKAQERRFDREREDQTELPDTEEAILARFGPGCALPAGKAVLEDFRLEALRAGEDGPVLARHLRLTLRGPEHVGIVGRNGAGKTTLLREIARELLERKDLRAAFMPQDYRERMDPALTPVEFLAPSGTKEDVTRARNHLGSVKITPEESTRPLGELSGGQRAKIYFLKMILDGANVLLLDEPTRNLSPLSGPVIRQMLREFPGCILAVSHDRRFLEEVCPRQLELTPEGLRPR